MKKITSCCFSLLLLPFISTSYAGEMGKAEEAAAAPKYLTGYMTLTSNYLFRGVSLSNDEPAVQGSLTLTAPKFGIYGNVWASSEKFGDLATVLNPDASFNDNLYPSYVGNPVSVEFDTVVGITNNIGDFNYNLSFVRYNYPGAYGIDYNEGILVLTYKWLNAMVAYSSDEFGYGEDGTYWRGGFNIPLSPNYFTLEGLSISGGVGYFDLPEILGNSYTDYGVNLNITKDIYTLSLGWADTDHENTNFYQGLDRGHFLASITAAF